MKTYIDTSLLAAYYCPESLSHAAQKAMTEDDEFFISDLVELEFYSALATKVRTGELDASSAGQILDLFRKHLSDGFYRVLPIEKAEYELARGWIGRFSTPLRAADALHLAAAYVNALTVLTCDKGMAQSAAHLAVRCKLVGQAIR